MKSTVLMLLAATSFPLSACAATGGNHDLASAESPAASVAVPAGADIGGAVGGVAGAVWADRDNDGRVDGYVREGSYYSGAPGQYLSAAAQRDCRSVRNADLAESPDPAGIGAATGAGVGALAGGINGLGGALVGAAVGGLAGAVWADANNDGCADGYVREGQYYEGAPSQNSPGIQPAGPRSDERG